MNFNASPDPARADAQSCGLHDEPACPIVSTGWGADTEFSKEDLSQ